MVAPTSSAQSFLRALIPLAVAAGMFAAAVYFGPGYLEQARTIGQNIVPPEGTDGHLRSFATFRPAGTTPVPLCVIHWKRGKSSNSTFLHGDNRVTLKSGRTLELSERDKFRFFFDSQPYRPRLNLDDTSPFSDARWEQIEPNTKYQSKLCLAEDELVWVEGCIQGSNLVACPDQNGRVLVTAGGPSMRRKFFLAQAHGTIGLGLLGAVFLFVALNIRYRISRRVLDDLARQRGVFPVPAAAALGFVLFGTTLLSLFFWTTPFGSWFSLASGTGMVVASLVATLMRFRVLGAAAKVLTDMQTSALNAKQGGARELAVRIAPDAPTIAGFRPGEQHALVQFRVKELYTKKVNGRLMADNKEVAKGSFPRIVPVLDSSGQGALDPTYCLLDATSEQSATLDHNNYPAWMNEVIGQLPRAETHKHYQVEWVTAQPGDPLLIFGGVERIRADAVGASVDAHYRQAPEIPIIRGSVASPALVHVGDEAGLLSGVGIERRARVVGVAILATALVVGAALFFWMLAEVNG